MVHGVIYMKFKRIFLPNTIDSSSTINQYSSLSVGLVVKKYWNKLLHLSSVLQQHEV